MNSPMDSTNARTILEGMTVDRWPGVYVLGCIDRRVTIYSQQVRALNLAAALMASGRVKPGDRDPVVVVGAGTAGLTCAAGLQRLGAAVVVLEAEEEILPLFRLGSTRWLHPGVYDWPLDGWDRDWAGLPLLNWRHGTVEEVRDQLVKRWHEAGAGVDVRFEVGKVSIGIEGQERRKVVWNGDSARTRTVILAVGFGLEEAEHPIERRYWEADDLDDPLPAGVKTRNWLVSGCGDGALTDLLRLCIDGFKHERMLTDFAKDLRMEGVRAEIQRIENDAEVQDDPASLHDAYQNIHAPWVVEAMKARRRPHQVTLATDTDEFLTRGASPLNRFLAAQLYRARAFNHIPQRVKEVVVEGKELVVRYGDETTHRFDRVQRRHGPVSALEKHFPLVAKAFAGKHASRRSEPTLTDRTREPLWVERVFGDEERTEGARRAWVSTVGGKVDTISSTSDRVDDPELARYLAKVESLHCELRLAGFETKVRVPIGLEELYEPLDAVINRSAQRQQVFKASEEADGHDARVELAKAFEVARGRGVVLLGDPGSGKTTHLKQVLLKVVREGAKSIGLPAGTVPVFLPLRRLRDLGAGLPGVIEQELRDPLLDLDEGFGKRLCTRGKLLFLLDGLDEVADAHDRRNMARWIEDARRASAENYFLVSCRFSGYTLDSQFDEGFVELHLRPMNPSQVERFVRKWYGIVERATSSDPVQAEVKAKVGADDLLTTLRRPEMRSARVYAMTHNPLLLTTICLVHRDRGTLPEKRVVLYEEAVSVLLERWRKVAKDLPVTFPAREALQVLMPVAGWMHRENERIRASVEELEDPMAHALVAIGRADVPARRFLKTIRDESGLLTGWGVDEFGFMHLGFQEYLAARNLRAQAFEQPDVLGWLAARFGESWWQEVILLLLAENDPPMFRRFMGELVKRPEFPEWARSELMGLCWNEAFGVSVDPFMDLLRTKDDNDKGLGIRQQAAVELLARMLPKGLDGLDEFIRNHPAEEVRRWWRARTQQVGRLTTKVVHGVELVLIPAGRFSMGSPEEERGRYDDEGPQHEVKLAAFWLARTPVTNAQYRAFLKANPGVAEPEHWGDRRYNQDEQPVIGVSWLEANAYCEWAGLLLPTEAQWEYACRANTTTRYWSGDSEDDLAKVGWYIGNSGGRLHAAGELKPNPWGLFDMHGNVYEWCQDTWVSSYRDAVHRSIDGLRISGAGIAERVVRGGYFNHDARCARSAFRRGDEARILWSDVGFRPAQGQS